MIAAARAADEAAVVALWQRCGLTRPWNPPVADFRRALEEASSAVLVWRAGEAIAGSVMVGDDGHRGWIYYLAVSPEQRRHGIGRALMTAAEDWLRARGVAKLQLMVRDGNDAALRFHAALGLEVQQVAVLGKFLG